MGKGSLVMFPSGPEGLLVCQEGDSVSRWNSGMTRSAGNWRGGADHQIEQGSVYFEASEHIGGNIFLKIESF